MSPYARSALRLIQLLKPALQRDGTRHTAAPRPAEPIDWSHRRSQPKPRDKVLSSDTHLWIRSLPWPAQPKYLCRDHPHLANRLAQCWHDALRVEHFMDDVLIDRRGHRKGVSEKVRLELDRLRQLRASARPRIASGAKMSASAAQAPSGIDRRGNGRRST